MNYIHVLFFNLVALPPEVAGSSCSVKVVALEKGNVDAKPPLSPTMSSNSGKATVGVSLSLLNQCSSTTSLSKIMITSNSYFQ